MISLYEICSEPKSLSAVSDSMTFLDLFQLIEELNSDNRSSYHILTAWNYQSPFDGPVRPRIGYDPYGCIRFETNLNPSDGSGLLERVSSDVFITELMIIIHREWIDTFKGENLTTPDPLNSSVNVSIEIFVRGNKNEFILFSPNPNEGIRSCFRSIYSYINYDQMYFIDHLLETLSKAYLDRQFKETK